MVVYLPAFSVIEITCFFKTFNLATLLHCNDCIVPCNTVLSTIFFTFILRVNHLGYLGFSHLP